VRYIYATTGLLALVLVVLIIAFSIGIFSSEKPNCTPADTTTHALCGAIDRESVSQAVQRIENGAKTLYISSGGGVVLQMYKLLDAIEVYEVDIVVFDRCLSACSILISATRQRVNIASGTVVGMHHSAFALSSLLDGSGLKGDDPKWKLIHAAGLIDASKILSKGLDARFLLGGIFYLKPNCISGFKYSPDNTRILGIDLRSRYNFWVPSRAIMEQLTGKIYMGWWPDADDMPVFEDVIGGRFNYEDQVVDASVMYERFSEIGICGNR
jgi:hypothetical protein